MTSCLRTMTSPLPARLPPMARSDIAWSSYGLEWKILRKMCVEDVEQHHPGFHVFLTILNVITNMMWGEAVKGAERKRLGVEIRELVAELTRDSKRWVVREELHQGQTRKMMEK
ncbi:flavonoid 3'-monooxygenase [Spatholobus suberectus]|nr:flavonoid 3'-monooxygenase [Spatholobus suberectus]